MTTQMNSPFAYKFGFAMALAGMIAVTGSVVAGNGEAKFDIATIMSTVDTTSLPVLYIENPI